MLTINDLKIGTNIQIENEPYLVIKSEHAHLGRGGATVRVKVRNLLNGKVLQRAYKPADKIESAELTRSQADFLYAENDQYYFMDSQSYEQFFLNKKNLASKIDWLKPGQTVDVLNFQNQPVSIQLPPKIELKVTSALPGLRGNTAQGSVTKPVILETGLEIQVPLFVKQGDTVRVNTETGEYIDRV